VGDREADQATPAAAASRAGPPDGTGPLLRPILRSPRNQARLTVQGVPTGFCFDRLRFHPGNTFISGESMMPRDFYSTAAQVLPVLLLALVWESQYLEAPPRQPRRLRRDDPSMECGSGPNPGCASTRSPSRR
jgi:hypothetical protein